MRKILVLLLLAGLSFHTVFSQITEGEASLRKQRTDTVSGWKKGAVVGVNVSQASLTNWAAGGQNSFGINGLTSLFANYKKGKMAWDNSLDIGYGLLKQGANSDFIKTDDRFDLFSKYGQQASKSLYYAALFNFKTQMTEGKDYARDTAKISNLLAPAYVLTAIGLDYKPNSYFTAFLAPLTGKVTIVNDTALSNKGAFGVTPGEKFKGEFGGYLRAGFTKNDFKTEVLKNFSLTTKLDLFSNYLHRPQDIDVSWETIFVFKVNKYITVNLNTHLIYDADILFDTNDDGQITAGVDKSLVQFKEILGVGFMYKF
ncbi:MAG: DUF3078 domain-containing protein [Paludibacter sp.]|nr:DUF3078 domain-containing protein [Paludibacter sp.]MDD4198684.1 DUF3078 domain-containing protein [Paludibacter sp.]MDD4427102.1 DUF3078 domain-containing protein [Paludibacter sp.]